MKVIATKNGYFGYYRREGEVFDVPDGVSATWFEPVSNDSGDPGNKPATPVTSKAARGADKNTSPVAL